MSYVDVLFIYKVQGRLVKNFKHLAMIERERVSVCNVLVCGRRAENRPKICRTFFVIFIFEMDRVVC